MEPCEVIESCAAVMEPRASARDVLLYRELVFLQLPVEGGAADAQEIRRNGAIALGVFQCIYDGVPLHLIERKNRWAASLFRSPVLVGGSLAGRLAQVVCPYRHGHKLGLLGQQMVVQHGRQLRY